MRASVFTWPQVDKRFPFQENFFLKDQEVPAKAVIELLGPLVTPERLQSLDKVLLNTPSLLKRKWVPARSPE